MKLFSIVVYNFLDFFNSEFQELWFNYVKKKKSIIKSTIVEERNNHIKKTYFFLLLHEFLLIM